jgi:hypothetical protein
MIGNTNLASANYDFLKFFSSFFAVCAILAHELGKSGIGQPYGHFLIAFYHLAARDRLGLTNSSISVSTLVESFDPVSRFGRFENIESGRAFGLESTSSRKRLHDLWKPAKCGCR